MKIYRLMSKNEFSKYENGEVIVSPCEEVYFVPENLSFSADGTELSGPISENAWFFDEFFYRYGNSIIVEFEIADTSRLITTSGTYYGVEYPIAGCPGLTVDNRYERKTNYHKEVVVGEVTLPSYSKKDLTATAIIESTGCSFMSKDRATQPERVWEPITL